MTIQELDIELEKIEAQRLDLKKRGADLQKIRAELIEADDFDAKLATMQPVKRFKFLKRMGKTAEEIAQIEEKLKGREVLKVEANIANLTVESKSA